VFAIRDGDKITVSGTGTGILIFKITCMTVFSITTVDRNL
jgi:hypothetical protein